MELENVCRTCLKVGDNLGNLFSDTELPHKIKTISSIEVSLTDGLPPKICSQCVRNVHLLYDFRSIIIRSSIILKERCVASLKSEKNIEENSTTTEFFDVQVKSEDTNLEEEVVTEVTIHTKEEYTNDFDNLKSNDTNAYMNVINVEAEKQELRSRTYHCKLCEFICKDYGDWRSHKRKHAPCEKSVCNICGKTIRTDNLKKHISIHTESPVKCNECGKTCKNSESLRGHALIHKNIKLQCSTCGKVYKHRAALSAHVKRHKLGDVKTVACPVCGKLFFEKRFLEKHIRSHTGERPYPCEYCKKGFSSTNALKTHKRQHTNEKPYICKYCPMAFPQNVSLKTHLRIKHPETITLQATSIKGQDEDLQDT